MKKIRFGSFPMTNIDADERQCIDTYSMKNFADLITMSTSMGNIQAAEQQFITPDVIMKFFKNNSNVDNSNSLYSIGEETKGNNGKVQTIKRAFNALKDFNRTLNGNPFYRDRKTLSIYLESINKNGSHDYDFLLLANDLVPREILDEITYSDQLSLMFLVLKDQLFSHLPMSQMGVSGDSASIKGLVAQFIEFSKSNNIDPITAVARLIKIAGKSKQNSKNINQYGGLRNIMIGQVKGSLSDKLNKMFKDGEIKDAHYLLNTIKHQDISSFFNDMHSENKNSHTRPLQGNAEYQQSNELERKYLMSKSQEYNKVLSIIDSLIIFNKQDDVLVDLDNVKDMVIKTGSKSTDEAKAFNSAKVIDNLQHVLFEDFVGGIVKKTNTIFNQSFKESAKEAASESPEDIQIAQLRNDISNMREEQSYLGSTEMDLRKHDSLENHIGLSLKEINNINLIRLMNPENRSNNQSKKIETSVLTYDIDLIQSDFVMILQDLENLVQDEKVVQALYTSATDKNTNFIKMNEFGELRVTISQLVSSIEESMIDSYSNDISTDPEKIKLFRSNLDNALISEVIDKQLNMLFLKLIRNLKSLMNNNISNYADSRIKRNPLIHKTTGRASNFKTYIFSEELMDNLYTTLNYLDTQKYLAGLLSRTPVKINNPLNKYEYLIKRLGLSGNPIFIISEKSRSIVLASPDYLSLTGSSMLSRIRMDDMINACRIDYTRDIWNNAQMFKQLGINAKYDEVTSAKELIMQNDNIINDIVSNIKAIIGTHKKGDKKYNEAYNKLDPEKRKELDQLLKDKTSAVKNYNDSYNSYNKANEKISKLSSDGVNSQQQVGTSNEDVRQERLSSSDRDYKNGKPSSKEDKWKDKNNNKNNKNNRDNGNNNRNNNKPGYFNKQEQRWVSPQDYSQTKQQDDRRD